METMVQLDNVSKKFDESYAVENVSLNIKSGEFLTLLGPSGCGKTTTLRMIAGFEKPTSGSIYINGKKMDNIEPYHREVNTVFQSYSLFPHMTVFDNIAFGLKMKKVKKEEIEERVNKVLKMVQLADFGKRKPKQLSGGQQQRVAIARAIVNNPSVLLLDEPLGALDLKLRKQMQLELKHLQQELNITFIYVTHDQEEALTMSDRIVVMNAGKIEQAGTPYEIYEKPQTRFVADFIGETNIIGGNVTEIKENYAVLEFGSQEVYVPNNNYQTGEKMFISVRPEKIHLHTVQQEGKISLKGRVKEKVYIGSLVKWIIDVGNGNEVKVQQSASDVEDLALDTEVFVSWNPDNSVVLKQ